jgi:uracil-DNA glycosylase
MKNEIVELIKDVREQVLYLNELGIDSLDVTIREIPETAPADTLKSSPIQKSPPPKIEIEAPAKKTRAGARLSTLPSLSRWTAASTEQIPQTVSQPAPAPETIVADTMFGNISGLPESSETMEQIWADIGNCIRCPLHEGRTQIVHTVGNYQADLMFVGEAPGADEDAKGEPFVGRAGQLLNKIIEAIGMKREEVCIGNINRCRPPGNRQPTLPEAHTCKPFLLREIAVIRPKVIVVMGNTALHNLLDTKVGITRMRGQFHDYFGVKVMPTFHPAYLLRDPSKKREVWDDMKKVRDYLNSVAS